MIQNMIEIKNFGLFWNQPELRLATKVTDFFYLQYEKWFLNRAQFLYGIVQKSDYFVLFKMMFTIVFNLIRAWNQFMT